MLRKAPKRVSFREKEEILGLPNLIEIQLKSYEQFLQKDIIPSERESVGLQEVFNEIFPVKSNDEMCTLDFVSYDLGIPKYIPSECIKRGLTYNAVLTVKFRLTDETGIKEEDVYMGTLPLMTDRGTFIINGIERVIVSQLHRSPGIAFEKERHPKGITLFSFKVIPYRGSWLEASFDINDLIYVFVDRKKRRRKILATLFVRALGLSSDSDIIDEFFDVKRVLLKSEKDFVNFAGKILAEDVLDKESGVIFGKAAEKLTTAMLKRMLDMKKNDISIIENCDENHPIIKMLARDTSDSYESALKEFYKKIRPGEPCTLSNARSTIMKMFFDQKRYSLGKVGRYKLNKKLNLNLSDEFLSVVTLKREDIIAGLKYLIDLKSGKEYTSIDDIDHLGNRRIRSVGELVQNQCRIGFARMEKIIRERMNLFDFTVDTMTPGKLVSAKGLAGILKDFFGRSQLSQFMDQSNPISELTHKRRLSCLGPGGLNRARAGFEVRDVHASHYGRICPIETPEGPNIGLITSLASYAKINDLGFIETPYRIVKESVITAEIEYMTADREEGCIIAQASEELDEFNMFKNSICWARYKGEPMEIETNKVTHMDVSPKQMLSIVSGLIPFLEHDDANRALMGSNMQRQSVPLLKAERPIVGTGSESITARYSGALMIANERSTVEYVDGYKIIVAPKNNPAIKITYELKKFVKSNAGTCINQTPLCSVGDDIEMGDVIADGAATENAELALGKNVLVAFMPWFGYNYEDAIIISEELIKEDTYTSMYIEEFDISARDTKLGREEITKDIPNVSEESLRNLNDDGIIKIGAEVKGGDILVGKITPKSETELSPEERLLRAIFGEKAADVKDASLIVPPGTEGVVMDVKIFSRRDRLSKTDDELVEEAVIVKDLHKEYKIEIEELEINFHDTLGALLLNETAPSNVMHRKTGEIIIPEAIAISQDMIESIENEDIENLIMDKSIIYLELRKIIQENKINHSKIQEKYKLEIEHIKKGDIELQAGVVRQVKVYLASKRTLQEGDKMAGRHGNKGVVAKIVPHADMPYMKDGKSIQMILNPLGVPSRMNMGQLLETHLGFAAKKSGIYVKAPVFEGFPEDKIWEMMRQQGLPSNGKFILYDGKTGKRFYNHIVVGYIYMMKLSHLVADKIHARAIGPYSLVTQQPLGGKSQRGGQRFGEMEVWALEAYGASNLLQEMLTVKSDNVEGRTKIYKSIVKGEHTLEAGIPESFNVLIKEMKGLCLDIRPEKIQTDEI